MTILCYLDADAYQDFSRSELLALVAELRAENAALRARWAELETELAKARKNSRNSSKPPSSDNVRPAPAGPAAGRRPSGAHAGHERHPREPFPPEQVDRHEDHKPGTCPDCGGPVRCAPKPSLVTQQVEWVEKP
jgi:transposase